MGQADRHPDLGYTGDTPPATSVSQPAAVVCAFVSHDGPSVHSANMSRTYDEWVRFNDERSLRALTGRALAYLYEFERVPLVRDAMVWCQR